MDIKYTTDGKKVCVVGILNSHETIVQEIFVSNGNEIPSGENFVVKTLHDEPCESWKSKAHKEQKDLDEKLEKQNTEFKNKIRQLNKEHSKICKIVSMKTNYLKKLSDKINNTSLNRVFDFITGKIKYLVVLNYDPKIVGLNSGISEYTFGSANALKLITLFGSSDGEIDFSINCYSDGCGFNYTVMPCKSYNDAVKVLSDYIHNEKIISHYYIEAAKKYNITISKDKLTKFYGDKIENLRTQLQKTESDRTKCLEAIKSAQKKLIENR